MTDDVGYWQVKVGHNLGSTDRDRIAMTEWQLCWISRYLANQMSCIINTGNRIPGSYGELN